MKCIYKSQLNDAHFCKIACMYCTYTQEASCKHKKTDNVFDIEKKILKAQTPEEIDTITAACDKDMLRNVIKLLVERFTPTNTKMNRILMCEEHIEQKWKFVDHDETGYDYCCPYCHKMITVSSKLYVPNKCPGCETLLTL